MARCVISDRRLPQDYSMDWDGINTARDHYSDSRAVFQERQCLYTKDDNDHSMFD